jgi:hypothetical protein
MRRVALTIFVLAFAAGTVLAVDLGKAEGSLTVDANKFELGYAYAIRHHKNQLTNRTDNTLIILTDKPLPDDANLHEFEASLPDGVNGVMVCLDRDSHITHVAVQHPTGMFDGGFFEGIENYDYKPRKAETGVSGTLSSRRIKTNTMTFSYDVNFAANARGPYFSASKASISASSSLRRVS